MTTQFKNWRCLGTTDPLENRCFGLRRPQKLTKSSPSIWNLLHNVKDFVKFCGLLRKHELYLCTLSPKDKIMGHILKLWLPTRRVVTLSLRELEWVLLRGNYIKKGLHNNNKSGFYTRINMYPRVRGQLICIYTWLILFRRFWYDYLRFQEITVF